MHTTDQLNTALAGTYAIERKIGAGGMAVVYLARDLRHNRLVALKVLNPELGAVLGSERFTSEIQVTANLHHPNLLPLFDSGEAGGLLFYVMPYVEGETLRQRLARERQLAVDEAVRLATAIAGALDYAHRQGVIHRDLKPENILMHEGQPLVMDFGIALAVSNAGGARITQTGLSLGTPQYMSPEQATGDHLLDARSDIYSLGAVLYEMLIGDPPHTGSTVQAVIAKVITEPPASVRATRPTVPEHVEAALMIALAKLPADRFATAADFAAVLSGNRPVALSTSGQRASSAGATSRTRPRAREIAAWAIAAAGVVAAVTIAAWPRPRPPEAGTMGRFAIQMPESVALSNNPARMAMSADGARFALLGSRNNRPAVYLWSADNPVGQLVRGTEGANTVAFSPNGQWLLVSMGDKLVKVPVSGGAPSTIATATATAAHPVTVIRWSTWGDNDRIVFGRGPELWITTAAGAEPRVLPAPDTTHGVSALGHPDILPGGTHALVELRRHGGSPPDSMDIAVVSLADGSIVKLGVRGSGPHYVAPGYIVYGRSDDVVDAAPFSLRRRAVSGAAARILDGVTQGAGSVPDLAVATNGWMLYRAGSTDAVGGQLIIVDRAGNERTLKMDPKKYADPTISPDAKRLVVRIGAKRFDDGDLWIYDLESAALSVLTTNGTSYRPRWSRDGKRVVYMTGTAGDSRIVSRPWDGSGAESVLVAKPELAEIDPGPLGGWSAIRTLNGRDIYIAPTESLSAMRPFVVTPANETAPVVSPDGQWLAYVSDETKQQEVYVRPIPGPGPRIPISVGGGSAPHWSHDGATIFYRGPSAIVAAALSLRPTLSVVRRDALFADKYLKDVGFDVFPNGREFVFAKLDRPREQPTTYLLVNWQRLLASGGASVKGTP